MYLEDVANWIVEQDFDFIYWNMLHDAYYFSIGTLPEKAKRLAQERLEQARIPEQFRDEFSRIIDFMNNGASLDGKLLRIKAQDLDFKRKESLSTVMPELASSIDYEA
jgi:hypothetical protein